MLRGDGFRIPQPGALVGLPSDPRRAHAWQMSLGPRQIEIFESIAADLLRYLGYELRFGGRARPPSRTERARSAIREMWRDRLRNRWRERRRLAREISSARRSPGRSPRVEPA
jgi:hypothetical protein